MLNVEKSKKKYIKNYENQKNDIMHYDCIIVIEIQVLGNSILHCIDLSCKLQSAWRAGAPSSSTYYRAAACSNLNFKKIWKGNGSKNC